jgi:hypothetical protein
MRETFFLVVLLFKEKHILCQNSPEKINLLKLLIK